MSLRTDNQVVDAKYEQVDAWGGAKFRNQDLWITKKLSTTNGVDHCLSHGTIHFCTTEAFNNLQLQGMEQIWVTYDTGASLSLIQVHLVAQQLGDAWYFPLLTYHSWLYVIWCKLSLKMIKRRYRSWGSSVTRSVQRLGGAPTVSPTVPEEVMVTFEYLMTHVSCKTGHCETWRFSLPAPWSLPYAFLQWRLSAAHPPSHISRRTCVGKMICGDQCSFNMTLYLLLVPFPACHLQMFESG